MTSNAQRTQIATQVAERASRDPQFRQDLLQNPHAVLQQEVGVDIPDTVQITVLEETPSTFYLVLPPAVQAAGQELSDMDLASVAGGWTGHSDCGTCGDTCSCHSCAGAAC